MKFIRQLEYYAQLSMLLIKILIMTIHRSIYSRTYEQIHIHNTCVYNEIVGFFPIECVDKETYEIVCERLAQGMNKMWTSYITECDYTQFEVRLDEDFKNRVRDLNYANYENLIKALEICKFYADNY